MGKFHFDYKSGDLSIYKWENSHTYHLKILGKYVVCLAQCVLLIKKCPNKNAPSCWHPQNDDPNNGIKALVSSVGERKWILMRIKVSDVSDSHLWGWLLGFKCESAKKILHWLGMEEMLDLQERWLIPQLP